MNCNGDHDHEWVDDSYDHEYGTESCGYWECVDCGNVDEGREAPEPPVFDEEWH